MVGRPENAAVVDSGERHSLDRFTYADDSGSGFAIDSLDAGSELLVRTRTSEYHVVVLDPCRHRVLVQGGTFLPEAAEGIVQGSSSRGSLLKIGWIGVGLRLELVVNRRRIVTSPVQSIALTGPRSQIGFRLS
jgi:hypothetical protein